MEPDRGVAISGSPLRRALQRAVRRDVGQTDGLAREVLDLDRAGLRVAGDLRGDRELAHALAVAIEADVGERELVLGRARPVERLPGADRPIRRQHDLAAAVVELPLTGEVQIPA